MNISKKEIDTAIAEDQAGVYGGMECGIAGALPEIVLFSDGRRCFLDDGEIIPQVGARDDFELEKAIAEWDTNKYGDPTIVCNTEGGAYTLSTISEVDYGLVDSKYVNVELPSKPKEAFDEPDDDQQAYDDAKDDLINRDEYGC